MQLAEWLIEQTLRLVRARDRRQPDPAELGGPSIRRILLISCTALGDTVLSTPAFRSLRRAYPAARITLLIHPDYQTLFAQHPDVDELIPYAGRWKGFWATVRRLRAHGFDLACILHGNEPQATPLAYLSGARFIFKLPNTSRFRFLLSNREPVVRWEDLGHGIEQRLAVARLAGGRETDQRMTLPVPPETKIEVAAMLAQHGIDADTPLVAFQVGASTASRRWAAERFVALGKALLDRYPQLHIIITGSSGERELAHGIAERIAQSMASPRVWAAAGEMPLRQLPALLQRCTTLVTGDTGPMHVAIAVGTPVVALFAVSDWRRSGPAYDLDRHIVIQKWRTCDPCLSKRCPYREPLCMENISVEEVLAAVITQLDRAASGSGAETESGYE